ncbi:MAG: lipocalin family protein [Bacteroidota bacterium]
MKTQLFFALLFFVSTPFFLSAQSIVGDWLIDSQTADGTPTQDIFSMKADGTFTVDFGSDGKVDVLGTYTINGDQITIQDTPKESPCYGKKGIYEFKVEGDIMTGKMISDECELRRSNRPMKMTRKQ